MSNERCDVSVLKDEILTSVEKTKDNHYGDVITFTTVDGKRYRMFHDQGCCESVNIEDIIGDLDDLVGSPILMAEEVTSNDVQERKKQSEYSEDSFTWTFYKFATMKGYVTIRWLGESNGYYSEGVDFATADSDSDRWIPW